MSENTAHEKKPQESERDKSGVQPDVNAALREHRFDVEDDVQMRVTVEGSDGATRSIYKKFKIAAQSRISGDCYYQLKDCKTNALYKGGEDFSEGSLSSA